MVRYYLSEKVLSSNIFCRPRVEIPEIISAISEIWRYSALIRRIWKISAKFQSWSALIFCESLVFSSDFLSSEALGVHLWFTLNQIWNQHIQMRISKCDKVVRSDKNAKSDPQDGNFDIEENVNFPNILQNGSKNSISSR